MSLLHREIRPLGREIEERHFRDDRRFLVACDDTHAPEQYFNLLRISRVQIIVVPTTDGTSTPAAVLARLLDEAKKQEIDPDFGDECWMVLDTDHLIEGAHLREFTNALRDARNKQVRVALSRPCFELWLLLHHVDETTVRDLVTCAQVNEAIKAAVGTYNKTKLRSEHFEPGSALDAIERAESLDASVPGGDIPATTTTRIYQLLNSILERAEPAQLPPPLRGRE